PGLTPITKRAPNKTAVVPEPGIPKLRSGTNAPLVAALFAVSGPVKPATEPFPNSSGFFDTFFSVVYPINDAIVAPAPGNTPNRNPSTDSRDIGPVISLKSCLVNFNEPILSSTPKALFFRLMIKNQTSASANKPSAMTKNSIPFNKLILPNVKRAVPV